MGEAPMRREALTLVLTLVAIGLTVVVLLFCLITLAVARDDGRYAQSPLKGWFDQLRSKGGSPCCSDADGTAISDVDWEAKDGHYRVRIDGKWVDVPDDAEIAEPNKAGVAMVWPFYLEGRVQIRCFMPGAGG